MARRSVTTFRAPALGRTRLRLHCGLDGPANLFAELLALFAELLALFAELLDLFLELHDSCFSCECSPARCVDQGFQFLNALWAHWNLWIIRHRRMCPFLALLTQG